MSVNDLGATWIKKGDEEKCIVGRNGDSLMAPFQCDYCWFVNLNKQLPDVNDLEDKNLLVYIRRVNLDIFWSRAKKNIISFMKIL